MLVARGTDPAAYLALLPWLATDLASPGGFLLGLRDALVNGVGVMAHLEAQRAELLLDLHHPEPLPSLLLKLRDQRLQARAQPPQDAEPAVAVLEAPRHRFQPGISCQVEPTRPPAGQLLFKFVAHCACSALLVFLAFILAIHFYEQFPLWTVP